MFETHDMASSLHVSNFFRGIEHGVPAWPQHKPVIFASTGHNPRADFLLGHAAWWAILPSSATGGLLIDRSTVTGGRPTQVHGPSVRGRA